MTTHHFVDALFAFTEESDESVFRIDVVFNPPSVKSWDDMRQKCARHFADAASKCGFEYDDDFSEFLLPDDKFEDVQKGVFGSLHVLYSVNGKLKNNK